MNTAALNSAEITVINDGQFLYPVLTADLTAWIEENGKIADENYEKFCDEVPCLFAELGIPGSSGMIDLCEELIATGAASERLG